MKTVGVSVRGIDDNFRWSRDAPFRELGRLHADACVTWTLGIPRDVPEDLADDPDAAPSVRLTGRDGHWLALTRTRPGSDLRLASEDGEEEARVPEIQATYRVRSFVAHWGEETEVTAEIRLPPEARAAIADRERIEDDTRRRRMAEAGPTVTFVMRPFLRLAVLALIVSFVFGLGYAAALLFVPDLPVGVQLGGAGVLLLGLLLSPWLFFRHYRLVVDRESGEVREQLIGKEHLVAKLEEVKHADVAGDRNGGAAVVLVLVGGGQRHASRRDWPVRTAAHIADAVNDALDLPSAKRKVLAYRRRGLATGGR